MPVEYTPTVNDLADLLADAMRRPLTGSARRPQRIHFRGNPRWDELYPHLQELGIEAHFRTTSRTGRSVSDFLREMRKASPGPIIMLSPDLPCWSAVPPIDRFGRAAGRGRQAKDGFVVRAVDDGGLVFENSSSTLAEAMAALEAGLAGRFRDHEANLRSSSLPVKKTQRMLHHDA